MLRIGAAESKYLKESKRSVSAVPHTDAASQIIRNYLLRRAARPPAEEDEEEVDAKEGAKDASEHVPADALRGRDVEQRQQKGQEEGDLDLVHGAQFFKAK